MKRIICLLSTLLLLGSAWAQDLSGNLGGMTLTAGTYHVVGDIYVNNGETLVIDPGVTFLFEGDYQFDINGLLTAVGTETDSIKFMPAAGVESWGGIDFNDAADDNSQLGYCVITGSNSSGIEFSNTNPTISYCSILNNSQGYRGGGIRCVDAANPSIIYCLINNNYAGYGGGGVYLNNSSPTFDHCMFIENNTGSAWEMGSGIYCDYYSNAVITNCIISYNLKAGLSCYKSNPTVINSIISS